MFDTKGDSFGENGGPFTSILNSNVLLFNIFLRWEIFFQKCLRNAAPNFISKTLHRVAPMYLFFSVLDSLHKLMGNVRP